MLYMIYTYKQTCVYIYIHIYINTLYIYIYIYIYNTSHNIPYHTTTYNMA